MGGKTKQALRTKNNAKPSSSSRSAEQLGTTAPFFVGFSAQPDGNLVPFAPGFESAEQMPDTFDASIDPQIQIILRKLAKKDPMTKKKALQELHELITACDLESLKNILPLWPKYYHNLANDIEHAVREQAQLVQQLLFLKCGRAMAPFLKQLVPVWLGSRYDSYAPAASIARNSFRETFARTCEVCLHCQYEIIEYCSRNLSVYTPTTLSIGKHLKPEESEQKYQRVVMSSLKALSFFVEQTSKTTEQENIKQGLAALLAHVKFWTFAKHKHPSIRAAWFECIYRLLQCVTLLEVITPYKSQLIAATFQSIDDADPLVVPHVWACVLLLQINFEDWYSSLNIRKTLLPKLSTLLRNGFNQNAQAICPNLLPFLSKISAASLHDLDIYEFYMRFFEDFKSSVLRPRDPLLFKSDTSIKHRAYFECLRFILQNINKSTNSTASVEEFALRLLEQQILEPIKELLRSDGDNVRYYFQHTSALVAFWDRECNKNINKNSCVVYVKLLNLFWARIIEHIPLELANKDVNEQFLSNVLILLQELHVANPSLETPCVKFLDAVEQPLPEQTTPQSMPSIKVHEPACFIEKELKELTVKLVCICMENARNSNDSNCFISRVRTLTKLFTDAEFYKSLTPLEDLKATLDKFIELLLLDKLSDDACDSVVGIIFEILSLLKPDERFAYIAETLLKIRQHRVQNMLLQRLLSYPLCTEPAVRQMLGSPESCAAIDRIAKEIVVDSNKDKLNLLQKCFFQTDAGDILINKSTVDQILLVMCAPLEQSDASEMLEICGSFIAQIMPVAFGKENSSPAVRQHVFLKLYKFSLEQKVSHHLSEDTLWEITTCWQDALLSNDIEINKDLLQCCSDIAEKLAQCSEMNASSLESMAGIISEFIISLTKNIDDESQRSNYLEETILAMLSSKVKTTNSVLQFEQHCVFLETLKFSTSPGVITECAALNETNILPLLRRTKLNFAIITKLVCCAGGRQQSNKCEDELNEDFYDPNDNLLKQWSEPFILELMQCMQVQAAAQTWLEANSQINEACKELVVSLSIQVSCFMGNGSELVGIIKQRLQQEALKENSVMGCRLLGQLVHYSQYAAFEENAAIILHDDLAELLIQQGALRAYVMTLQHLLPKLSQKALNLNSAIMRSEPPVMWVKAAVFRCLLLNNFESELNNKADYHIIVSALQFLTRVGELQNTQKELLHYNVELLKQPYEEVLNTLEIIKLLNEVLQRFPHELNIKNWDLLRIGLSSWVLTVSKSIKYYNDPKTSYFIAAVYQLFATLSTFIRSEKQKSSTELLKNVIDEWESLFATEVNVLLFKAYYDVIHESTVPVEFCACFEALLECLMPGLEMLDYSFVYRYFKTPNSKHTLDHLCNFLLKQLHSSQHSVRVNAAYALRQLTLHFVADEIELYDQNSNNTNAASKIFKWHFLNRFEDYLNRYDALISIYLKDFSFKLSELDDLKPIDKNDAYSYLLLWDCIINACAKSPVMLRSIYTSWLNENQYETNFLNFLFRVMPVDILKNHSAKVHSNSIYKDLSWSQLKDSQLSVERYACHLYTEVLRKLPAVVRKWWNTRQSRQKNFVDNLTTNYVSALICSEELNAIANRKEKHENMQVTVHKSTREVLAVYAMDEARMELVISLAPNYPLGAVKVECGKQIGGRASSRNVGMQLTIFLTHQNGTIYDGLTLWKNNLDKKFDGVEECYICYTVIHQDTCQLPKLTCKTCKKKFHGPCLYKWFTTSSKSTCPICRNVF